MNTISFDIDNNVPYATVEAMAKSKGCFVESVERHIETGETPHYTFASNSLSDLGELIDHVLTTDNFLEEG